MNKKFLSIDSPVFETKEKQRHRLKVYLDQDIYKDLVVRAGEKGLTPAALLAYIVSDWVTSCKQ